MGSVKTKIIFSVLIVSLLLIPIVSVAEEKKEEEMRLQVFLTKEQALALAFPGADKIETEKKWLTPEQMAEVARLSDQPASENRITYYIGMKGGKPMGYLVMDHVIGKSYPINFMVLLSPDGKVQNVEIMVYREPQGWEVRFKSFLQQFFGKDASSDFKDVNSITGATISVRSVTRGVRKAVVAYKVLYLNQTP